MKAAWAVIAVAAACTVAAVSLAAAGLYLPGAVAGAVSLVVLGAGSGTFAAAVRERWRQLPRRARDGSREVRR